MNCIRCGQPIGTGGCMNMYCPSIQTPTLTAPNDWAANQWPTIPEPSIYEKQIIDELVEIKAMLKTLLARKKPKKALIQEWIEPQHVKPEVWQDFLKHRKEKRKPMKETVYKSLLKRFKAWHKAGHDLDDILQTTIDNDWTGVFEPMVIQKKNGNQQPEVFSQSFQTYDPNAPAEIIDAPDPYAELKK